ncbi:MAG TPA: hypothetical protein VI818_03980 [Candidatus Thermoplasmatota archaeon]|nr:hypothetical protein [Candidatus Thermoplasmatota archaeon]
MRRPPLLLAVLLVVGCFGPSPGGHGGDGPGPAVAFPELVVDHDHKDPRLHNASVGLRLAGFADAALVLGTELGRFSDIQFWESTAIVTVNGRAGAPGGGFVVLDLSTTPTPTVVGRYRSGSEDNWYTKISPDGRFVFLTANGNGNPATAAGSLAQGGSPLRGIHIVDVRNPRQPALVGFLPAPVRVVNLAVWTNVDKAVLVAASMVNERAGLTAGPAETKDQNYVGLYEFVPPVDLPNGQKQPAELQEVSRWRPTDATGVRNAFPHDLAVGTHPLNGKTLLFVAYWDAGGYILDVTDPTRPAQASHVPPMGATDHVHTFKPHAKLIAGKYYAALAPETFGAEAAGFHRLIEITDARKPQVVGAWTPPPGDLVNPEPLLFSPHEFHLANERLYASQFHAGVWVLQLPSMEPISMWQASQGTPERTGDWAVDVSQAVWYRGHLYAVDMANGILILDEDDVPFA